MVYNIWMDVSAVTILVLILSSFYFKNNIPLFQNRVFAFMVWMNLLSALMDMLSGIWYNHLENISFRVPFIINSLIQLIYFVTRNLMTVSYLLYIMATLDLVRRNMRKWQLIVIPITVVMVMILLSPVTGWVYVIDEQGKYNRGELLWILYAIAVYYLIGAVWVLLVYRKLIPVMRRIALGSFVVIAMTTVGIQALYPTMLLEGFGTAVCLLMIYLTIQKPEETLDGSTGLLNRKMFATMVSVRMRQKEPFTLGVLYLEDYTFLEKSYGMEAAEQLMSAIASYLKKNCTNGIYRIANDRVCVMGEQEQNGRMKQKMEQIMGRFFSSWNVLEYQVMIPVYSALIRYPEDAQNMEMLMELVDAAVESGEAERGCVMDIRKLNVERIHRENQIGDIVKHAVENNLLEVVYQPIYSVKKDCFTSAEALLRLRDPQLGNISPDEFIPIAEKNGAIMQLGQFVLESVCRLEADTKIGQYGIEYIEVNLSVIELLQNNLEERIMQMIGKYGLKPGQINLEITETCMSMLPDNVTDKMNNLLKMGVTFSLDDYGTGYSNMSRMIALPLHIVKLDKSIVQEAFQSEAMKVVLDHTLQMLGKLNKLVLAEGVETAEQAEYLKGQGCHYIQGYYYGRPVRAEEFCRLIREQSKKQEDQI